MSTRFAMKSLHILQGKPTYAVTPSPSTKSTQKSTSKKAPQKRTATNNNTDLTTAARKARNAHTNRQRKLRKLGSTFERNVAFYTESAVRVDDEEVAMKRRVLALLSQK